MDIPLFKNKGFFLRKGFNVDFSIFLNEAVSHSALAWDSMEPNTDLNPSVCICCAGG